jgi:ubiquitin-protein ligase
MVPPRIRRLAQDYQLLQRVLKDWPLIQISGTAGLPPEMYRFTYNVRGLYVAPTGEILERNVHVLEVNLTLGYPRRAPQCRMLTPVFHPNFDDSTVCIGDFWAASEGLDDLIIRIGRMITYQEYNTKSPLNGLAAKWAAQNAQMLPVDARSLAPALEENPPAPEASPLVPVAEAPVPATAPPPVAGTVPAVAPESDSQADDPWAEKIVIS